MLTDTCDAFDLSLLQYKTVLQSNINREQIRQSFQCFLGRLLVPTQLYQRHLHATLPATGERCAATITGKPLPVRRAIQLIGNESQRSM
jgi:hypothetical protein